MKLVVTTYIVLLRRHQEHLGCLQFDEVSVVLWNKHSKGIVGLFEQGCCGVGSALTQNGLEIVDSTEADCDSPRFLKVTKFICNWLTFRCDSSLTRLSVSPLYLESHN